MTALVSDYSWVPAAPFRAHLRQVLDATGLPWPVIALKAGIPLRLTRRLLFTHRERRLTKLPRDTALRLLMVEPATIAALAQCEIPADETHHQLHSLLAAGCSAEALARYCQLSVPQLMGILTAPTCSELTALLIRAACVQVGWDPAAR